MEPTAAGQRYDMRTSAFNARVVDVVVMAADLSFEGCNFFRQRLVLATLSGKSIRIKNIRAHEDDPGLKGE